MYVVSVAVEIKAEYREAFLNATLDNAHHTRLEPGNLRFDVLASQENPSQFMLYEVYRDESGMAAHKETEHYARWRETVEVMMAIPRVGTKYDSIYPEALEAWSS
ncbi:MAG: antibiotic biosynthesis monooxygenase [Planctomycetota bacterium]|jgi:quinol monooxygenase YgiN